MSIFWFVFVLGCESSPPPVPLLSVAATPPFASTPVILPTLGPTLTMVDTPWLTPIGDFDGDGVPEIAWLRVQSGTQTPSMALALAGVIWLDGRPPLGIGDKDTHFSWYDNNISPHPGPVDVDGDGVHDLIMREHTFRDCEMSCDWDYARRSEDTFKLQGPQELEDTGPFEAIMDTGSRCADTCNESVTRFTILYGGRDESATWDVDGVVHEHLWLDVDDDGRDDLVLRRGPRLAWARSEGVYVGPPQPFVDQEELFPAAYAQVSMAGEHFDRQLLSAGDMNGDGAEDLILRPGLTDWATDLVVLPGGVGGPGATPLWRLSSAVPARSHAEFAAALGDVNGDGYDDIAAGADYGEEPVFIAYGGPTGLQSVVSMSIHPPTAVGDFDGDGFDDVVSRGAIYRGSAAGLTPYPRWVLGDLDSRLPPSALGGDLDGDGHPDLVAVSRWRPRYEFADFPIGIWSGQTVADDTDGDGTLDAVDCAFDDPAVSQDLEEVAGNTIDEDCDGVWTCGVDGDGDGWLGTLMFSQTVPCAAMENVSLSDCNDADSGIHPGVREIASNDVDEDCDARLLCACDSDGDGWLRMFSTCLTRLGVTSCPVAPAGRFDCDDYDPAIWPGAPDDPTRAGDMDCDGTFRCRVDADGDGAVGAGFVLSAQVCPSPRGEDCDDQDPSFRPDARDVSGDDLDQDCDGDFTCLTDRDGDGWSRDADHPLPCSGLPEAPPPGDCDDARASVHPGRAEIVGNPWDDDCDGVVEHFADRDGDGFGGEVEERSDTGDALTFGGDCDDANPHVAPGHPDPGGDAVDGDCDGTDPFHVELANPRTLVVRGVPAGGSWWLAASTAGSGPCTPVADGMCVDLVAPVLIGSGTGGRNVSVTLPRGASGQVQALARVRGVVWRTVVVGLP